MTKASGAPKLEKSGLHKFVRRIATSRKTTALLLGNKTLRNKLTYSQRLLMLARSVTLAPE